jgi:hypothetical protein
MYEQDWQDAGAGWQGKEDELQLMSWSRQRRIVILQRRIECSLVVERDPADQLSLGFAEINGSCARQKAVIVFQPDLKCTADIRR